MGVPSFFLSFLVLVLVLLELSVAWDTYPPPLCGPVKANDSDRIEFALNLEFLEAQLFLCAATGKGLDSINKSLAKGGPPSIGCEKANLDDLVYRITEEFAYQEVGHIRAIVDEVGGFPRPLINISRETFAEIFDRAVGYPLKPPFDPYKNSLNFLLTIYLIPYVGLVGYVGAIPNLESKSSRRLVAKLLGVESGQDAVIRALLYERGKEEVYPYKITVEQFTIAISSLFDELATCGIKDEGLRVPLELGAENRTTSNILSADVYSLSYARTETEILRTIYGTGDESKPGGFFPRGANGNIARSLLDQGY
ncbi:hypothetical protein L484_009084 [Morus notabilis]|uniref:Desiccation-related protein PCC13-62 n=1 Tax=Morus notabilis TaxID=981085 RepID=W9QU97_9ROSA|nr:desiccation-related protein PCC13-62 [Morus notabilis]EXB40839.1 hypothetical protein L484_009084 [Morus notabilis]